MISFGKTEYIPEQKKLWQKIFGDSERYLDSFFDKVYRDENTLVYLENNSVVAALYMIPYKMLIDGKENEIIYLYALATHSDYRGQKIMSKMIQKSIDISKTRNYALSVLIPAEPGLFEFYRKFGYEESFEQVIITKSRSEIEEIAQGKQPVEFKKADAEQIWNVYSHSTFFSDECIILNKEQNQFYIDELEAEGGTAFVYKIHGEIHEEIDEKIEGYVLLQLTKDHVTIFESDIDAYGLGEFCATLLQLYKFKTVTFYQPVCFTEEETRCCRKPFAMVKKIREISLQKPYINRVLM